MRRCWPVSSNSLLELQGLQKHYPVGGGLFTPLVGVVRAVDGVSFAIGEGETLGLVGESGCGKSTLGRLVLRLEHPTAGHALFRGRDIFRLQGLELKGFRRQVQMIFQDPQSSLDPRMTVGDSVGEALLIHGMQVGKERGERVEELFLKVGLEREHIHRYPHEFSGGQKQRVGIARALATSPRLLVADEPVSALDLSIQAQILNLMKDLQEDLGLSYLFIAHDLGVIRYVANRVAVMYLGKIVELSRKEEVFSFPLHPYTEALLSAALPPRAGRRRWPRILLGGEVPSPMNPPGGCPFHPRCHRAFAPCPTVVPQATEVDGRLVVCHLWG
ncbi:MAG: ATP-binding cassette domain-containing protein [Chloroflexi bacterium]|nr:ATP-binding cassette domain-containing protein [Chloroflexota bacterium]